MTGLYLTIEWILLKLTFREYFSPISAELSEPPLQKYTLVHEHTKGDFLPILAAMTPANSRLTEIIGTDSELISGTVLAGTDPFDMCASAVEMISDIFVGVIESGSV